MATLSVNAAKTFGGRNLRPRALGRHHSCYRLLTIMTVVWGSAFVIVAVCLVLNFCNCTHLPVIYSKTSPCAFTGPGVRLLAFGVPVAASLLVSTGSFLFVILSVRKSKKDSKMVRARESMKELQDQVKIYGKLAILFGITWILSFTVGIVGHVALKYIDAIVNPLQGVFIFAAFCLNQRVRAMWRGWLGKRTKQEGRQFPVPKGSTTNLSTISSSAGNTKL
ncbi:latrophilin receptor-like protein A [Acanthaster planci]|uniref:Latrophilin receptor-like protein A n=1 Tax=Acanthaster planci TaxID=133434 RepID=A0A8B7YB09_ACAPL|nr:latrophilin receptor-like protein A [Acanthaster planci]